METILTVKEESMIAVADAVRDKAGVEGSLSFPNGMVDAINSIETSIAAVEVDNKTIIQDENGVISTAIGGYYADPVPAEMLYENNNNITLTYAHHENLNCVFDGYFPLPNWSPIGEEHYGKAFRLTWYETPYSNSPDYVIECFADAWFLDENLQTIMVENRENTELVAGSIDNNTGYLSCMPHIYENPDDWEWSYVSNFRIEVPGSDGGAVPISAGFIPQEVWDEISNAYVEGNNAYSRADEAHNRIDYLEQNGGGGASDAASITFDDTAAQIGVDNIQAAIEYLADEAANSTSVQEQIDTTIKDASQYLRRLGDNIYLSSNVSNASNYNWTNKNTCPNVGTQVLYWDLDDMEIQGCYTDSSKNFKKSNNFFFRLQKGHYYSTYYLEYDSFRNFYNEFGAYPLSEYYFGIAYNDPYVSYTIGHNPCALYCGASVAILFTDITYVYADAASGGVSEDRVNELINEALGVIEDGYY